MSIRCAMCGSKNVYIETKKEGYNLKAGVVGTALVGVPGALAGAVGNENTYYHCRACGAILNKPMLSVSSDWIDMLLNNPENWENALLTEKEKYKNIEWEKEENVFSNSYNSDYGSDDITAEKIADEILNLLKRTASLVDADKLEEDYTDKNLQFEFYDAENILEKSGRVAKEFIDSKFYYKLVTDDEEIKERVLKASASEICEEWLQYNEFTVEGFGSVILTKAESHTSYSREEVNDIIRNIVKDRVVSENPYVLDALVVNIFVKLKTGSAKFMKENNEEFSFITVEEYKKEVIEAKIREEAEYRKRIQPIVDEIEDFLFRNPYEKYAVFEMMKKSPELNEYSNQKLSAVLKVMEQEGTVVRYVESKRTYFALTGLEQRLEQKKVEDNLKAEKARKDRMARYKAELIVLEEKLKELNAKKREHESIYKENKSAFFGAKAQRKKEAVNAIKTLEEEIIKINEEKKSLFQSLQNS